jgi:hypothetical protein
MNSFYFTFPISYEIYLNFDNNHPGMTTRHRINISHLRMNNDLSDIESFYGNINWYNIERLPMLKYVDPIYIKKIELKKKY